MKVIGGCDAEVAAWVAGRMAQYMPSDPPEFGKSRGYTVVGEDDETILAGVVFHDYSPKFGTCQVSVAADSARWATRRIIRELLSVPFYGYGCRKVWSIMAQSNERAIKFNLGIGFKREAILSSAFGPKAHAVVTSLRRGQFEHLYGARNVKPVQ